MHLRIAQQKNRGLGLILIIACVFLFFLVKPDYYSNRIVHLLLDSGHILFFYIFSIWFASGIGELPAHRQLAATIVFTAAIGTLIEVGQHYIGRSASLHDVYRDVLGATFYCVIYLNKKQNKHNHYFKFIFLFVLTLIMVDQRKLFIALKLEIEMYKNFPALVSFNSPYALANWDGEKLQILENTVDSKYYIKAKLEAAKPYSTLTLKHFVKNWEDYNYLEIYLYLPSNNALNICFKITDRQHNRENPTYQNRFNFCQNIHSGLNHFKIPLIEIETSPLKRKLDLSDLSEVTIFSKNLKVDKNIYIYSIELS